MKESHSLLLTPCFQLRFSVWLPLIINSNHPTLKVSRKLNDAVVGMAHLKVVWYGWIVLARQAKKISFFVKKVGFHPFLLLKPYASRFQRQPNRQTFFPGDAFLATATLQNYSTLRSYLRSALQVQQFPFADIARFASKGMVPFHYKGVRHHACNRLCYT
tara:strand:- start:48 stop:527 length:480 start_codon:yes stop_codon:yes gene_type:complete